MSKLLAPVSGFACIVWLSAWFWFLSRELAEDEPSSTFPKATISVHDGDFEFTTENVPHFLISSPTLLEYPDRISVFDVIASRLKGDSSKQLKILGYQAKFEQPGFPANLALSRAGAVKYKLVSLGVDEASLVVAGFEVDNLLLLKDKVINGVQFEFLEKPQNFVKEAAVEKPAVSNKIDPSKIPPFTYKAGKYKLADIQSSPKSILDSLRVYLRNHPEKKITITGYSNKSEAAKTSSNLAESRAMALRRYLVDTGLRRDQINVKYFSAHDDGASFSKVELTIE